MRPARGATSLSGVLAVDKPAGMTSHDVVAALRRATGERRIGHAGTLDPLATGLMLVLVGPATRLAQYLSGQDKSYETTIVFGIATDTLDADGTVTGTAPVPETVFDAEVARRLLASLEGPADQVPPVYSAIKTGGVVAHRAARAGDTPDLAPRPVVIHEARLLGIEDDSRSWRVALRVSKGTYVRAFARDVGEAAGTLAHVASLRRTAIGDVHIVDAQPLADATAAGLAGVLEPLFIDPVRLLGLPVLADAAAAASNGAAVPVQGATLTTPAPGGNAPDDPRRGAVVGEPGVHVVLADDTKMYAVYRCEGEYYRAETVIPGGVSR